MANNDTEKATGQSPQALGALHPAQASTSARNNDSAMQSGVRECDNGILRDLANNSVRVRALLFTHGNTQRKKDFVASVDVLRAAGASEVPLFKALLHNIPLPKAYMMAACLTPLYTLAHWCIPFSLASPRQFFQAIMVAKTRMLANAAADAGHVEMYNAARDKLWKDYERNEDVPASHAPHILLALEEPYWSFTTYRTQIGESRASAMRYVPTAPAQAAVPTAYVDDLADAVTVRKPLLATPPQQRHRNIVLTDDDLDNIFEEGE